MKTGYVDFFDGREGKLFGFMVVERNRVFFHYANGLRAVPERGRVSLTVPTLTDEALRLPRRGDEVMCDDLFIERPKGPRVARWWYASEYKQAVEACKRSLTIEEAVAYLRTTLCEGLDYTHQMNGGIGIPDDIITFRTKKVEWFLVPLRFLAARGEWHETARTRMPTKKTCTVTVYAVDYNAFKHTTFVGAEAERLFEVGIQNIQTGEKVGVQWSGGHDDYVVDPTIVRNMTDKERIEVERAKAFPTPGDERWLRCTFAPKFGGDNQVVRIIRHLGGGD
jgi:hypothetical protein